jgi:iron(II)-dependent oxidoreductase
MTDTTLLHNSAVALCRDTLTRLRASALYPTTADGYLPLLVNYTHEDAEAKGLRKLASPQQSQVPVYFSALEMAGREPLLFLTGERGSGKSTFALHLALHLAGDIAGDQRFHLAALVRPVPRNDHGDIADEAWPLTGIVPCHVSATGPTSLASLLMQQAPGLAALLAEQPDQALLLIIDEADRLGASGTELLRDAATLVGAHPNVRLLIAGAAEVCAGWVLPAAFRKHTLLPLLAAQREAYDERPAQPGEETVLGNTGRFMLSQDLVRVPATDYALVQEWLLQGSATPALAERIIETGFRRYAYAGSNELDANAKRAYDANDKALAEDLLGTPVAGCLEQAFLQPYLAAQHLATLPARQTAALFYAEPDKWRAPVTALAHHLGAGSAAHSGLISALMTGAGEQGLVAAVLVADLLGDGPQSGATAQRDALRFALQHIVEEGTLALPLRAQAGRHLARYGDRRDLDALVHIKAGSFTMGSAAHPNSNPPHRVMLGSYRIGQYPVTNRVYGAFVAATGRPWHSVDGLRPERGNAPAVDLSWHDARAFCEWLTTSLRARKKIAEHEVVRLPSEPEWEYAARGAQPDGEALVYPWAGDWDAANCNGEDSGFNDTCTVGLFPAGRSPFGCYDMAGQIWEWTTTLWGDDMATPSFRYPYQDDGREDTDAPANIRRVLRGGCFSSGAEKANCTYRGSLEPNGFWRGNGFRIVIAVQ